MSLISEKKDFKIISDLIPNGSSVIDVGCNDGSLLQYLNEENNINGRGMEIDQDKVQQCLSKGISVIEGDADTDLFDYPDNLFDFSRSFQFNFFAKLIIDSFPLTMKPNVVLFLIFFNILY